MGITLWKTPTITLQFIIIAGKVTDRQRVRPLRLDSGDAVIWCSKYIQKFRLYIFSVFSVDVFEQHILVIYYNYIFYNMNVRLNLNLYIGSY